MRDLKDKIQRRIHHAGRGTVHVSKDFLDLGNRAAVDQALSRLVKSGTVRRIERGLFYYPRVNPKLGGELAPDPELVAAAIGRRRASRVVPSGATAANALGLSTQVPGGESISRAPVRASSSSASRRCASRRHLPRPSALRTRPRTRLSSAPALGQGRADRRRHRPLTAIADPRPEEKAAQGEPLFRGLDRRCS